MAFTTELTKIDNAALTTKTVDGTGLFDILMKSMHNHLNGEFEKGRITGQEYTKAYIELSSVALNGAIQFLLQRDNAYLQGLKIELETKTLEYNLEHVLPLQKQLVEAQVAGAEKDNEIKDYNLTNIMPAQWDGIIKDNDIKTFNLTEILPQQKILLQEQTEVQRAQTLDTRTDGTLIVGSVGKQKDLYNQQITSYKRDAEAKAAKPFIDAWITMKTLDEGLVPPNNFTNASLDVILTKIKTNNELV